MIPRFNLYGDMQVWKDNIQEAPTGHWCRWKDVEPYLAYCQEQGFEPPTVVAEQAPPTDMVEKVGVEETTILDEDAYEYLLDEGEDLYDLMMKGDQHAPVDS